ncbi:MAG: hypothetical protein Q9162_002210 [Coniocarpon cinnabarinum]
MTTEVRARPYKPRPNRRTQQSLVFVEPFTKDADPIGTSKSAATRHTVKKWSMLNRKNRHIPNSSSSEILYGSRGPLKHGATAVDEKGRENHRRDETSERRDVQRPSDETVNEDATDLCVYSKPQIVTALAIRNDDPFDTMPISVPTKVSALLRSYVTHHTVHSRPWFQPDDDYGSLLVDARKHTWLAVARESGAAYAALLAFLTATSPFQSDVAAIREGLLGEAYRRTNSELASRRALANSTVLAVVMMLLIAEVMGDDAAFQSHARGLAALLQSRRENPGQTREFVQPEKYPFEPLKAAGGSFFSGAGFEQLRDSEFISRAQWDAWFKTAMVVSGLVVRTPGDTFWWSALAQNKWLLGPPTELGLLPLDTVFRATTRLNWHLVVFQGALVTSPIVRGMITTIRSNLTRKDVELLLVLQPFAVIWIALSAGPYALNLQDWFHTLLQGGIVAAGRPTFKNAAKVMENEYLWHLNRDFAAEKFWHQGRSESKGKKCCRPDITDKPSQEQVEKDMMTLFRTLEFDVGDRNGDALEMLKKRCKACLCAWWV